MYELITLKQNNMRTVCVYHSIDLDGWMSAAIVKHWFSKQQQDYVTSKVFKEVDVDFGTLEFIGYNYGQPIPDLSMYDKVIMCDISFPMEMMQLLHEKLKNNFIVIDHHKSFISSIPIGLCLNGKLEFDYAACELTWKYFFSNPIEKFGEIEEQNPMPEIVRLLGRYDFFGHKGTDEEQKVLEFQYGARQCISTYEDAYEKLMNNIHYDSAPDKENLKDERIEIWNSGISIYQYLCTEAKQAYENGFDLWFPIQHEEVIGRKFICINKEIFNPINFGIDYHKDGYDGAACFHRRADGKWSFSLYNDNGEVDCSIIAKEYGGGGHKGASGFVVDDINAILK